MNPRDWLASNTFHHGAFRDIPDIIREKERQGLKISVCIPTLNEGATIGKEIVILRSELMQRHPLVDELAVIDSGSTDGTREIAASFGAEVHLASEILPETGAKRGKGENLWKAIHQLRGDVIVYVDADIKNIRPHFVYGLVAPLVYRPDIKYVKAFYDRPLVVSGAVRPSGGGRVTEILVRPLFSLFFPDLTAIVQPLSGEYAVRREVLEQIHFPVGYGVETSHLIDVYQKWGLGAFGQTDMDRRVHRNQATRDLGKMAFAILRTFLARARAMGIVGDLPELGAILRQFQVHDAVYEQVEFEIVEEERPPMITVPAYRRKFGRGEA